MSRDSLRAARGIVHGTLIGVTLWAIIAWIVAVVVAIR